MCKKNLSQFFLQKLCPALLVLLFININQTFAQNKWSWVAGYSVSDAVWNSSRPTPSPLGVPTYANRATATPLSLNSTYKPSVREHCGGGLVNNNEIYIYGGATLDFQFSGSDIWVYDIAQQKWAFVEERGRNINFNPVTDAIGVESNTVWPGARNRMASAIDKDGNMWVFGGLYYNADIGQEYSVSDLWRFNTKTRKWTFFGQDDYSGNKPVARYRSRGWFDANNNFWIYAGANDGTNVGLGSLNDLWMYNTTTNVWTCISGNKNTFYAKNTPNGNYPAVLGTGGTQYFPRARSDYGYWIDNSGKLWIYGGYAESHGFDNYGDLWSFNPTTKVWTLYSGSDAFNPVVTTTNPGGRDAPYCWNGNDGKLYMFGGLKQWSDFLRDTWRINPATGAWELVANDNLTSVGPISAGYRVENATNMPGTQVCTLNHITTGSHTYMFNGYGYGSNGVAGFTGALWRYSLNNYSDTLAPVAKNDSVITFYKSLISIDITLNDLPKYSTINTKSIDVNINVAGKQDSLVTTAGTFKVDTLLGLIKFKPIAGFTGTATLNYTFQNSAKYVSNTAQVKLTLYPCTATDIALNSPNNDESNGNFTYKTNGKISATNKVIVSTGGMVKASYSAQKSILLLPGFVSKSSNQTTFEAKIEGCN